MINTPNMPSAPVGARKPPAGEKLFLEGTHSRPVVGRHRGRPSNHNVQPLATTLLFSTLGLPNIRYDLRRRFARLEPGVHFLDRGCLLPDTRGEGFDFVLLSRIGRFLLCDGRF